MEKMFLTTSGGNEPRAASSVSCEQNTCSGSDLGNIGYGYKIGKLCSSDQVRSRAALGRTDLIKQVQTSHVRPLGLQQLASDVIQFLLCAGVFRCLCSFFIPTLPRVLLLRLSLRGTFAAFCLRLVPLVRKLGDPVVL